MEKRFNLTPFGVPAVLKADFDFGSISSASLRKGHRTVDEEGQTVSFELGDAGTKYTVVETLGEGTYGIAYKTVDPDGNEFAIKYIKEKLSDKSEFIAFLKECIIQLLVVEVSKDQPRGPFAPKIYDICFNRAANEGYVRSQLMRNTLENLVGGLTPAQNNAVVPDALKQISAMMKFLQKELYFNHRDMKGDNIMYDRAPDGRGRVMRFIDFGMSCITWAGMKISGSTWFDVKHTCFKKDRDMSQLVYYIQHYLGSKLSAPLLNRLQLIIRANVGARHKCEMAKLCPARGLKEWRNTYNFLDRENVRVPAGTPEFIETNMQKFLEGKPFESPPKDPVGICPPGKIRNPKTGRCVKNKSTPLVGNVGPAAPCPPDKIFNPRTRRCVKKTGAVGRLLAVTRRSRRRN